MKTLLTGLTLLLLAVLIGTAFIYATGEQARIDAERLDSHLSKQQRAEIINNMHGGGK